MKVVKMNSYDTKQRKTSLEQMNSYDTKQRKTSLQQSYTTTTDLPMAGLLFGISHEAPVEKGMPSTPRGRNYTKIDRSVNKVMENIRESDDSKINPSLNKVMENIRKSDVGKIGIYGRAGIGKTTFVQALKDRIALTNMFECIIWVTVPEIWNLTGVQLQISQQLPSHQIKDIYSIGKRLEGKKFLLILDNVHQFISLQEVRIPEPTPESGSKMVLTSRSEEVCNEMAVDLKIRLEDLFSWQLFHENVGEVADSPSIQPLADEVVSLCCYHSDAILLMAAALRDIYDTSIWGNAIETLRWRPESHQDELEHLMANVLKFSYQCLQDDNTRECLKSYVLCYEKGWIATELLIQIWIEDGLIDAHDYGEKVLETLVNFNLLKSMDMENGIFVKMRKKIHCVLLEYIIPVEEGRLFLIQGSMGLKKPPNVEVWGSLKEICLMDNQISELPINLSCPKLQALFLERNYKIRAVSPSFFDNMPALQVLNLSRTSIRSLPESLFRLVNLKRLFLNHCNLILTLSPEIGELKQLEILDLEGTKIMYLPIEVGQLTKLTSLEVSFFEPTSKRSEEAGSIIPCGVVSSLSKLEELSFDVDPDDKRWSASAEAIISEVSKLPELSTLKLYFPMVQFLSYFRWDDKDITSQFSSPISFFKVTVGHIIERVISRVPRDTEFELERHDRYLKYVNGEGVPEDIKKVLKYATAFFLDRHSTVRTLSEFCSKYMRNLECCVAGECNELQAIVDGDQIELQLSSEGKPFLFSLEYLCIYYVKSLKSFWQGPVNSHSFHSLKYLTLRTCPELTTIFTPRLQSNFFNLEELTIDDCPKITSLISSDGSEVETNVFLPNLKRMSLHFLPNLESISNDLPISPELELMSFRYCWNLKSLPIVKDFNLSLRKIKGEQRWWQELKWENTRQDSWNDVFEEIRKFN